MSNILKYQNWRYATKKFDASKKVSVQDLETILESIKLSPSSFGLQPYHIFVITDEAIRKELQPASWGQTQIVDASHLLVFAVKSDFGNELVDDYIENVSATRGVALDDLKGYSDFMKSKLVGLPADVKVNWTTKQAYIAIADAMTAAASLEIDTCPMEGFEPETYDTILELKEKGLTSAVVLAVGYRSEEDDTQNYPKVRLDSDKLFTHI